MLYYAFLFFVLALVAALFGFGGIATGAATVAKVLFWAFVALTVITGVAHLISGGSRRPR